MLDCTACDWGMGLLKERTVFPVQLKNHGNKSARTILRDSLICVFIALLAEQIVSGLVPYDPFTALNIT